MTADRLRVVVAQLGAREHYTIPRFCHAHCALARLHTDFWKPVPAGLAPVIARLPARAVRRLAARVMSTIPDRLVTTHSLPAAYWRLREDMAHNRASKYEVHRRWGEGFARRVAATLTGEDFTAFFGFSSASLEALVEARRLGALAVLDEIAPTHLEDRIMAEEQARFPGWEPTGAPTPRLFLERLQAEWGAANRIMVNSAWTRSALVSEGVPSDKIHVVPIVYEADPAHAAVKTRRIDEPLRVLWLGTLCLRKGLPYAIEVARRLQSAPVTFTFAGPAQVDLSAIDWPENVTYVGQVPRAEVPELWRSHHLYILPTLSDGFAITQIEAAAHGLPLIVTPNCGDVVEDGRSGILVPPRDVGALADAIRRFLDGEMDLEAVSRAAIERAKAFSSDAVWPRLHAVLDRHINQGCSDDTARLKA